MSKESEQRAIKQILGKIIRQSGNKSCSECGATNPRWASTNLGIFFCLRCSGIHRSMGVDISKVKSVSLDNWTREQVQGMKRLGNTKANKMWEATMPRTRKPVQNSSISVITRFIIDKYDNKHWYDPYALEPKKDKKKKKRRKNLSGVTVVPMKIGHKAPLILMYKKSPKKKRKSPKRIKKLRKVAAMILPILVCLTLQKMISTLVSTRKKKARPGERSLSQKKSRPGKRSLSQKKKKPGPEKEACVKKDNT